MILFSVSSIGLIMYLKNRFQNKSGPKQAFFNITFILVSESNDIHRLCMCFNFISRETISGNILNGNFPWGFVTFKLIEILWVFKIHNENFEHFTSTANSEHVQVKRYSRIKIETNKMRRETFKYRRMIITNSENSISFSIRRYAIRSLYIYL